MQGTGYKVQVPGYRVWVVGYRVCGGGVVPQSRPRGRGARGALRPARHLPEGFDFGYLAHEKATPPPGPPSGPRHVPTAGSEGDAVPHERGGHAKGMGGSGVTVLGLGLGFGFWGWWGEVGCLVVDVWCLMVGVWCLSFEF